MNNTLVALFSSLVGCILAELLLRVPFLPGESDLDQLTVSTCPLPHVYSWVNTIVGFVSFIYYREYFQRLELHSRKHGRTSPPCPITYSSNHFQPYRYEIFSQVRIAIKKDDCKIGIKNVHFSFEAAGEDLLELAEKLLALYPHNRCTCTEALNMRYFSNKPAPTVGHKLPLPSSHPSNKNADDEESNRPSINLKRKIEAIAEGVSVPKKRLQF